MVNLLGERRCARSKNSSSEVADGSEETLVWSFCKPGGSLSECPCFQALLPSEDRQA